MYLPVYTARFMKDLKRMQKRGKNLEKIKILLRALWQGERLDPIHRDHKLVGDFVGRRDCHVEADWVLIYKLEGDRIVFERTGSHSDLF